MTGIPCVHAISSLGFEGRDPLQFVDPCYSLDAYKRAYQPIVGPTNGPNNWPKTNLPPLLAPKRVKMSGRPKTKRRPEPGETSKHSSAAGGVTKLLRSTFAKVKCSRCGALGHNTRICKVVLTERTTNVSNQSTLILLTDFFMLTFINMHLN